MAEMLRKGRESARVLCRTAILKQLECRPKSGSGRFEGGCAAKTVRGHRSPL